jgi:UDP-N-acetylglucosamine 2-epimerase (non-hydrolysing)
MHKTIVTVTGIRPDFIRMSEIFKRLDEQDWCQHILIHTGQHYDKLLSDVFFQDLKIRKPDFNLSIGAPGKPHYRQQAEIGPAIIELFKKKNITPDLILFLGDSNSVLAAVPLRKEGYTIGHIEAGMRSYDERMLEETNRKVCDHVSNLLFVYHENYKKKAIKEGIPAERIHVVGNTIIEPLKNIADLKYKSKKSHILLDIHRPENFKYPKRLQKIINFANLCHEKTGLPVKMLKFHRTILSIDKFDIDLKNIDLIDLMGYTSFVKFMQDSCFIVSDSGTAQEEPALLNVPVLVPREFTERPESLEHNNSKMVNLDLEQEDHVQYIEWAKEEQIMETAWLGEGNTSLKIVNIIKGVLS